MLIQEILKPFSQQNFIPRGPIDNKAASVHVTFGAKHLCVRNLIPGLDNGLKPLLPYNGELTHGCTYH